MSTPRPQLLAHCATPTTAAATAAITRQVATQAASTSTESNAVRATQRSQAHLPHIAPYPLHPISHPFQLYPSIRPPGPFVFSSNGNPSHSRITPATSNILSQHHQQGPPYTIAPSCQGFAHGSLPGITNPTYGQRSSVGIPCRNSLSHLDPGVGQVKQMSQRGHHYAHPIHLMRQLSQPSGLRHNSLMGHVANQGANDVNQPAKAVPAHVLSSNGYKDPRDSGREEKIITVRGRKVRSVDGASLYALCRSWLRNGQADEIKRPCVDNMRSLPRPLPISMVENKTSASKDCEDILDAEDEESVNDFSPQDLLKRHVKRAKRVRARLRGERLKRIARYKTRLALLLPLQGEQIRADASSED